MRLLYRLWSEDDGYILSSEVVLLGSLLIVGSIAGITAVRDSIVGEMQDVSNALGGMNQSFRIVGIDHTDRGNVGLWGGTQNFDTFGTNRRYAYTAGSAFLEKPESRHNTVRFNGGNPTYNTGVVETISSVAPR